MTRSQQQRPRRAAGYLLIGVALVGLAWAGVDRWNDYHVPLVTGLEEIAETPSCLYCHRPQAEPLRADAVTAGGYVSPADLAVSPDGKILYVSGYDADQLLAIDTASGAVVARAAIPGKPHGVAVSADGQVVAVTATETDRLHLLDAASLAERAIAATGRGPFGVALEANGERAWVADGSAGTVSLVAPGGDDDLRLSAGLQPYAVARSDDGSLVAVLNRLAVAPTPRSQPVSELTLIDGVRGRVVGRRRLVSAHLGEGVAVAADASFVVASAIRVRNLLPITQVARGGLMTAVLVLAETGDDGRTVQLPLDEVNRCFADPSGVALTPDGRLAFVASGGGNAVSVIDVAAARALVATADDAELAALEDDLGAHARYVIARIPTGANPRAVAMSPDGRRLYVAERLDDSVAVIDTAELRVVRRFDLGGATDLVARRRGERAFHDAAVTFQGQFSCRSCHPDGHSDGISYDFVIDGIDRNRLESRSLRGIRDTAPFKWNAKNPDLATQCGPRFALVLTKSDPFPPAQLADLVTYIESIPLPAVRHDPRLEPAIERGRKLFERTRTGDGRPIPRRLRCATCHRGPLFTDRLLRDVASHAETDTRTTFDTPHLLDIRSSPPYMHDGRAWSLEELWTVYNPDDTHGMTNDMTKVELNDLVLYLRSL